MLIEPETSFQEENRRLRQARVKQARELANAAAKQIRNRVRSSRNTLLKEAEDEVFRQLVARQTESIKSAAEVIEETYSTEVGRAYNEAAVVDCQETAEFQLRQQKNEKIAKKTARRFEQAKVRLETDRVESTKEQTYRRIARKHALDTELERTKEVLARPPPPKNEIEKVAAELKETKPRSFRVLESNVYQTTRYHLEFPDNESDKAKTSVGPGVAAETKKSVRRIKVASNETEECAPNPKSQPPQPTKKDVYPLVEQPPDVNAAFAVSNPINEVVEKEADALKHRQALAKKARIRGEAALKQERDSRHFSKLLADLSTLQQVWRKHDVSIQPHVVDGRMYVGADHVEDEKRAQQVKLERVFNPVVKAAVAKLSPIEEVASDSLIESSTLATTESQSSSLIESVIESVVESEEKTVEQSNENMPSFCWQEASVSTATEEQESTIVEKGEEEQEKTSSNTADGSIETTASVTLASVPTSDLHSFGESQHVTKEPEKITPLPQSRSLGDEFSSTTTSDRIETGILALRRHKSESTPSDTTSSSLTGGSLTSPSSSASTFPPLDSVDPLKKTGSSSMDWLMEHNRLLMAKIESHRQQIENQRKNLAKRLEQLKIQGASPPHSTHSYSATSASEQPSVRLFSPSFSSSFLSDLKIKQSPDSSLSSSSSDSSLSTGLLSGSSTSTPEQPASDKSKSMLSAVMEEESSTATPTPGPLQGRDFSLLVEQSSTSSSSSSTIGTSMVQSILQGLGVVRRYSSADSKDPSSISSSSLDFNNFIRISSKEHSSDGQAPMPTLSSTPRRQAAVTSSSSSATSSASSHPIQSNNNGSEENATSVDSSPVAFRSLLVDACDEEDDENDQEDVDDFDLPPPPLVGDESFLGENFDDDES